MIGALDHKTKVIISQEVEYLSCLFSIHCPHVGPDGEHRLLLWIPRRLRDTEIVTCWSNKLKLNVRHSLAFKFLLVINSNRNFSLAKYVLRLPEGSLILTLPPPHPPFYVSPPTQRQVHFSWRGLLLSLGFTVSFQSNLLSIQML